MDNQVPYIVYEAEQARHERDKRRWFIVVLVLILLLFGSNAAWIAYESQFEDIVYKEIKSVTDNGKFRSREEIDNIYKLMDILKDIACFEDDGYSEDTESYRYDGRRGGRSYDGESYRGRGRNAKRDSMGRYASEGSYRGSYRYSRDGKQDFVAQLEELMEDAPDEQTKKNIQRMVNDLG